MRSADHTPTMKEFSFPVDYFCIFTRVEIIKERAGNISMGPLTTCQVLSDRYFYISVPISFLLTSTTVKSKAKFEYLLSISTYCHDNIFKQ